MVQRVFMHIGLPKTGTTFVQSVLRSNARHLANTGLLYVGDNWLEHANASAVIRELSRVKNFTPEARTSWDRLRQQAVEFEGRAALLSHEYFCAASSEQAQRAVADLEPCEVHLILTVRDLPSLLTAAWQQEVKKRATEPLWQWWPEDNETPLSQSSWRTLDVMGILRRWNPHVPAERIHIVTVPPPGTPRDTLLFRFASACGADLTDCDLTAQDTNASLGVVATELKRRVNLHVRRPIRGWREVPRWLRDYLAGTILSRYGRERFRLHDDQIKALREKTEQTLAYLNERAFPVEGDLSDLQVRDDVIGRRTPDDVPESELNDVAVRVIADLVHDVRKLSRRNTQLERELERMRNSDQG